MQSQVRTSLTAVLVLVLAFTALAVGLPAFAQEDATSTDETTRPEARGVRDGSPVQDRINQVRGDIQDRVENRDARAEERAEDQDERREERVLKLRERVQAFVIRMVRRMAAAVDRFSRLADRMDSRIEKLQEQGVDTTEAESKLADARNAIAEAGTAVEGVIAATNTALGDLERPQDSNALIREAATEAIEALRAAHRALVDAVIVLRAASGDDEEEESGDDEDEEEGDDEGEEEGDDTDEVEE